MSSVRYYLALLLVITVPPGLTFWLVIHPFVRFWRRLGAGWAYGVAGVLMITMMMGLLAFRDPLLAREFGTSYPLMGLGALCLAGSAVIGLKRRKHLTFRILAGVPELARAERPGQLLTEGMYATIRHPRYVEAALGLLGYALFANYLATHVLFALSIPVIFLIVLLEERELHQRFGGAYEEYCRRVPRFVPRLGRRKHEPVSASD